MSAPTSPQPDFTQYYYLEQYLFEQVGPRYRRDKTLAAFDFFCIVIWKSNRAKSKVAARLLSKGHADLDMAVERLAEEIASADSPRARLKLLISGWGFRLPMASALLTVLFPDEFTVYDVRVCDQLGDFHDAQNKTRFDVLWKRYEQYTERVRTAVPSKNALRDKDRYLWGKSFALQLTRDIDQRFDKNA